jgi:hypothetical protein
MPKRGGHPGRGINQTHGPGATAMPAGANFLTPSIAPYRNRPARTTANHNKQPGAPPSQSCMRMRTRRVQSQITRSTGARGSPHPQQPPPASASRQLTATRAPGSSARQNRRAAAARRRARGNFAVAPDGNVRSSYSTLCTVANTAPFGVACRLRRPTRSGRGSRAMVPPNLLLRPNESKCPRACCASSRGPGKLRCPSPMLGKPRRGLLPC